MDGDGRWDLHHGAIPAQHKAEFDASVAHVNTYTSVPKICFSRYHASNTN